MNIQTVNYKQIKTFSPYKYNNTISFKSLKNNKDDIFSGDTRCNAQNNSINPIEEVKNLVNRYKNNIKIISPYPTKRNLKAFFRDPCAFLYEIGRPLDVTLEKEEILTPVKLKRRDKKGYDNGEIRKNTYSSNTYLYSINEKGKDKERLGYIDVYEKVPDMVMYIDYAYTQCGNREYKNILQTLVQSIIEDCIGRGFIPIIESEPAQVGNNSFNRSVIYNSLGLQNFEEKDEITQKPYKVSILTRDKTIEKMNKIKKSQTFLLADTERKFEELKKSEI